MKPLERILRDSGFDTIDTEGGIAVVTRHADGLCTREIRELLERVAMRLPEDAARTLRELISELP